MNIAMFTNTFRPHIGGVAHSVTWLADSLRGAGHSVLVVAPEFPGYSADEPGVVRVPAVQNFRGSDFSVPIPLTRLLHDELEEFAPDLVHSHHPFLLGDTALRTAASFDLPIIYTYHTRYELYGHYVAQDAPLLQRLVLSLALGYCDLCDAVVAPSASMAGFLAEHGVETPVTVAPTGIEIAQFDRGNRHAARAVAGISEDAFVVGHVGRLAPEKNLDYLAQALHRFLEVETTAHFLVVGDGPMKGPIWESFVANGLAGRVHMTGALEGERLADMYAAIDVFAFSSHSETQGLVLAEAMAAGVPVVALDAFGTREVVRDCLNGRLLSGDASVGLFAEALQSIARMDTKDRQAYRRAARRTAQLFTRERSTLKVLDLYRSLTHARAKDKVAEHGLWQTAKRRLEQEWKILGNVAHAIGDAVFAEATTAPTSEDKTAAGSS